MIYVCLYLVMFAVYTNIYIYYRFYNVLAIIYRLYVSHCVLLCNIYDHPKNGAPKERCCHRWRSIVAPGRQRRAVNPTGWLSLGKDIPKFILVNIQFILVGYSLSIFLNWDNGWILMRNLPVYIENGLAWSIFINSGNVRNKPGDNLSWIDDDQLIAIAIIKYLFHVELEVGVILCKSM